jgi:DMSO reductase anchor subunit
MNLIFLSAETVVSALFAAPDVNVMLGAVSKEKEGVPVATGVAMLVAAVVAVLVGTGVAMLVAAPEFNT